MNLLTRGLVAFVFSLSLLGISGCSEDNETEAEKLAKGAGSPGPASEPKVKAPAGGQGAATSSDDAFKQSSANRTMPTDYPAQKKRPAADAPK